MVASASGKDDSKAENPDSRLLRLRAFMMGMGIPIDPSMMSGAGGSMGMGGMGNMPGMGGAAQGSSGRAGGSGRGAPGGNPDPWGNGSEPSGQGSTSRPPRAPRQRGLPEEWGRSAWEQDWDPAEDLVEEDLDDIADEAEEEFRRAERGPPRDKWITPLLDFQSVSVADGRLIPLLLLVWPCVHMSICPWPVTQ